MYSPQGGEQLDLGEGFVVHLPPIPDKTQIINYQLPQEEQMWTRQPLPSFYNERIFDEQMKQEEERKLVEIRKKAKVTHVDPILERYRRREWYRRRFGVWIFINGVPTYLTKGHYFYLQYGKADHEENNGYPFYYDFSKKNFYIREWCKKNPYTLGYMFIGPRGSGKSAEEIADMMNDATMTHNYWAAIQTKHFEDDSKKIMIQGKSIPMFNALPRFFKPQYSHGTSAQESLVFSRASTRGSGANEMEFNSDLDLNSTIFAAMPGVKALDGQTLKRIFESEIGKTDPKKVADIYERHETNVKCVFRNHRKIGLLSKESTVEEMSSGGEECFKLWKDSDPSKTDNNGFTISKIHRHLISALDTDTSLQDYIDKTGKNWGPACDKFGNVDRHLANIKIQNDLDAVKDDLKKLSSRMRKSPRNETEAFIKDQSKSIFNVMLLSDRLNKIRNEMPKKPYVKGNLYWVKDKFGPVWWQRDDLAGRFNMSWLPDEFSQLKEPGKEKILNNVTKEWGYDKQGHSRELINPENYNLFRISTDPIKFTKTKDPRASKAAIHAFRMYDHLVDGGKHRSEWKSNNFFFEYRNRPEDPETYLEDLAMLCIFLGTKVLPERNVPSVNQYFEQNGLEKLLAYPSEFVQGIGLDVQTQSEDAGYASTAEVIDYYTRRLIPFINQDIGRFPFDDTIEDWLNFDPSDPTKSDLTVSSGFGLVHAEKISNVERPPESKISDWLDGFNNDGINGDFINTED